MKLIEPEVSLQFNDCDPLIKLEKIGRVCYKSDSEYTRETAIAFIKGLIKRGHMSVLEHTNFIFEGIFFKDKPFTHSTYVVNKKTLHYRRLTSCNLRAIIEQKYYELQDALIKYYPELSEVFDTDAIERSIYRDSLIKDPVIKLVSLSDFEDITEEEINAHLYTTFDFVTDRGVTHEMVRHRIASFTQESTRYCNYSNDRFGNELQFIRPATFDDWTGIQKLTYMQSLEAAEQKYMSLVKDNLPAQFARGVLPTDVRTYIVMTANHNEWEHFFDLRSRAKTGAPHPNMKVVASKAEQLYYECHKSLFDKITK